MKISTVGTAGFVGNQILAYIGLSNYRNSIPWFILGAQVILLVFVLAGFKEKILDSGHYTSR